MKITGSRPTTRPSQRREVSGPSGERAAIGFAKHLTKPPVAGEVAPSTPLAALEGVLAAQAVADPAEQRRRGVRHGHSVLAELRELQLGLVEGSVSQHTLRRLAGLLGSSRPAVEDPKLHALLDDLELRAAVELAKLGRGST